MIRRARPADIPHIVLHGEFFWDQTPYRKVFPYDHKAVKEFLILLLQEHYLLVAIHGEQVVGFIGVIIAPMPFNPSITVGTEVCFFVHPRHRGETGKALFRRTEADLKDIVDVLDFGDMCTSTNMEEYYQSRGYTLTERKYTKIL